MPLLNPFSSPEAIYQHKRLQPKNQHKALKKNKDQWDKYYANLVL